MRAPLLIAFALLPMSLTLSTASDHADPINLPLIQKGAPPEAGITGLFIFPANENDGVVAEFERTDGVSIENPDLDERRKLDPDEQSQIKNLIAILCVRPGLVDPSSLKLSPYTYTIHFDTQSTVDYSDPWSRARYFGAVENPEGIKSTASISVRLNDDTTFAGELETTGLTDPEKIERWSGVRNDPFILPSFDGTNVVAMAFKIPLSCFPANQQDWVIWGTTTRKGKQLDHVGRSLRTQNPRFGLRYQGLRHSLLNHLPPSEHVAAITEEHEHPSLVRDLFIGAGFDSYFGLREWDFTPDVMIFSIRYPSGFPNGRIPSDDVVALTAQFGDTLTYELAYRKDGARKNSNRDELLSEFPYLGEPHAKPMTEEEHSLSTANVWKIILIVIGLLVALYFENRLAIKIHEWRKKRNYWKTEED